MENNWICSLLLTGWRQERNSFLYVLDFIGVHGTWQSDGVFVSIVGRCFVQKERKLFLGNKALEFRIKFVHRKRSI